MVDNKKEENIVYLKEYKTKKFKEDNEVEFQTDNDRNVWIYFRWLKESYIVTTLP